MKIILNGKEILTDNKDLFSLCKELEYLFDDSTVKIINGFQTSENVSITEDDQIVLIKKGVFPSEQELESMLCARHTPKVYEKVKNARVAVAGLGGLGSNIALNLARTGVGTLHLIDFDVVEPSNLNRQQYMIKHLGMKKTEAVKEQISQINPFVKVIEENIKVTEENCLEIFKNDHIVCEAFDNPLCKAMLANCLLPKRKDVHLISSSGMAGCFSSNDIVTKKVSDRFYICGDMKNEAKQGMGLMAPRVSVCAGHQSNMALRIILGDFES